MCCFVKSSQNVSFPSGLRGGLPGSQILHCFDSFNTVLNEMLRHHLDSFGHFYVLCYATVKPLKSLFLLIYTVLHWPDIPV